MNFAEHLLGTTSHMIFFFSLFADPFLHINLFGGGMTN